MSIPTTLSRPRKGIILARVLQLLSWVFGLSFFAWAFLDARFRDTEGFLVGSFCLPMSIGIALLIVGWAVTGRMKQFTFWLVMALIGQAAALQLIEAGSALRYQHYRSIDYLLTETHPLLLLFLAAQTALVVAGFRTRWPLIQAKLSCTFKIWQLLGVGLIFLLSSATVSREVSIYIFDLFFAAFIQTINLGNIVLIGWALPAETLVSVKTRFGLWFGFPETLEMRIPSRLDRFAGLAAIWVIVLAAALSFFSYEWHPHVPDEVIYLYHARYLAAGMLTLPAPPVPEAFSFYMIPYEASRWYSIFSPGWPAVLAVGVLAGAPWLVNPILAGLNVLLAYLFIQEINNRRTARLAILLLCASPWYIFMSMNFMAHTFTLTCVLAAALGLAWARRTGQVGWGWLAGAAVGVVSLIRPLDGAIVGGLLGLWAIGFGGQRLKTPAIVAFGLSAVGVGAIVFPYNQQITGSPTVFPLTAYYEQYFGPNSNALGFGPDRGFSWPIDPFPGHSPLEAMINANLNTFSINIDLFGWSTGSLFIVAILLFSGTLRRSDYLMLAVIVFTVGSYSLYWFSGGPDFGARYWYLTIIPFTVLTVRGLELLMRMVEPRAGNSSHQSMRVIISLFLLIILALVNYFPWRAIDKYHHFRGMRSDMRYLAGEQDFGKSLVLIQGNEADYLSAWIYNPLDPLAEVPIYAWDQNPAVRAKTLKAYGNRPVWVVVGPSITHSGFKVVAGPLSATELAAQK
jgi:hypothetical protein